MLIGVQGQQVAANLGAGGTVKGDLVVEGDIKIEGGGSFAFDEIIEGTFQLTNGSSGFNTSFDESSAVEKRGIYFNSTANRGIHFKAGNASSDFSVQDSTGNVVLFVDNGNDRVGVNTSSPTEALTVEGAIQQTKIKIYNSSNVGYIDHSGAFGGGTFFIRQLGSNHDIRFQTNKGGSTTTALAIDGLTHNIGIGTESPSEKLTISANDGTILLQSADVNNSTFFRMAENGFQGGYLKYDGSNNKFIIGTHNATGTTVSNDIPVMTFLRDGTAVGIGTESPTEKLEVAGNILLPLNASNTSHKLKLTGDATSEIYTNSYDAYFSTSLNHYLVSRDGFVHQTSDASKKIEIKHDVNNNHYIASNMDDFNFFAGHNTGALGFLTLGGTSGYKAIQSVHTDNNTMGLKFNTKASGTDTERMRITSAGLVGIGTSSPSVELDVAGSAKVQGLTTSGTAPAITWEETDLSGIGHKLSMQVNGRSLSWNSLGDGGFISTDFQMHRTGAGAYFHKWFIAGSSKMILNNNGYLGIGTDSPGSILELSSSNPSITFTDTDGGNGRISANGGHLSFQADYGNAVGGSRIDFESDGTLRMRIDANSRMSLSNNDSGSSSTLFGQSAGNALTSNAQGNSAFGHESLLSNTDADRNTGFGYQTIRAVTTGSNNTAVGYEAVRGGDGTYTQNTGVGGHSLYAVTTATGNSALGFRSAEKTTTGSNNVALGWFSLYENLTGSNNVAIGKESLKGASGNSTSSNVAVGFETLKVLSTGSSNVAVGAYAGVALTTATDVVAIGLNAISTATAPTGSIGIGRDAGKGLSTGIYNIAIGHNAMSGGSGADNFGVAVGFEAMRYADSGNSVAIGGYTLQDATSDGNTAVGHQSLMQNTSGINTAYGASSLKNITTGTQNTAIGQNALTAITTGSRNTALGNGVMASIPADQAIVNNIAIGNGAMNGSGSSTSSVYNNISIGYQSMYSITTGSNNSMVGNRSGTTLTSGSQNSALGSDALYQITEGGSNSAFGASSAAAITTGTNNTVIGKAALKTATTANYNVAVGVDAMEDVPAGQAVANCVAVGVASLKGSSSTTTDINGTVGIGESALQSLETGTNNTAIGYEALKTNTDSNFNTAIGYQALRTHDRSGTANNTAAGFKAGYAVTTAFDATLLGSNAGVSITTGNGNTAVGSNVMAGMTTGDFNTAVGVQALNTDDVGRGTTAIGYQALFSQNSDSNDEVTGNTALGYHAGYDMTTGTKQTLLGYEAGIAMTTGEGNVAIGYQALKKANHANADYNIGIGVGVGSEILNGYYNVLIGYNSGNTLVSGGENTIIGHNCDVASGDNTNNIIIGNGLTASDNDNRVYIGNDSSYIFNDFNSNATWTHSSDERQKKEIKNDTLGLDFINDIRPVTYKHKSPSEFPKEWNAYDENDKEPMGGDKVIHGLIAQEVKQALDKQNVNTFSGWGEEDDGRQQVSFEAFVLPLIKAVQELSAEVNELKQQLKDKS